jgi:hypothetical protein
MGYYTDYTIEYEGRNGASVDAEVSEKILNRLEEISGYNVFDEYYQKFVLDDAKWYNQREDMLKLSEEFPDCLFTVNGVGEEHDDIWREFYLNGKIQISYATLVFDYFDPLKLKSPEIKQDVS